MKSRSVVFADAVRTAVLETAAEGADRYRLRILARPRSVPRLRAPAFARTRWNRRHGQRRTGRYENKSRTTGRGACRPTGDGQYPMRTSSRIPILKTVAFPQLMPLWENWRMRCTKTPRIAAPGLMLAAASLAVPANATTPVPAGSRPIVVAQAMIPRTGKRTCGTTAARRKNSTTWIRASWNTRLRVIRFEARCHCTRFRNFRRSKFAN